MSRRSTKSGQAGALEKKTFYRPPMLPGGKPEPYTVITKFKPAGHCGPNPRTIKGHKNYIAGWPNNK